VRYSYPYSDQSFVVMEAVPMATDVAPIEGSSAPSLAVGKRKLAG
jgi:hypothetical protein